MTGLGVPFRLDTGRPSAARIYNYWLGGNDNYLVDRDAGDTIADALPDVQLMARANRDFLVRAVQVLAGELGIDQFLDIGSGIPGAAQAVHSVAQAMLPAARVMYVDKDPIAAAHCRALLVSDTEEGRVDFILGDAEAPLGMILTRPEYRNFVDPEKPIGALLLSVLTFFEDSVARQLVKELMSGLPSGSYLTVSAPTGDFDPEATARAVEIAAGFGLRYRLATPDDVIGLFDGLELVDPGVVPMLAWRPGPTLHRVDERRIGYYVGMARKP